MVNAGAHLGGSGRGDTVLRGSGLTKRYGRTVALRDVDLGIRAGEVVAVVGPSGSGKTSLLHVLAGILPPDQGTVILDGHRIDSLSERRRSELRRRAFGFVFQGGMLVPELTALENAALPLLLAGVSRARATETAGTWLNRLGLGDLTGHRPRELTGGQAQRVAVARALGHSPRVVFADEPTGALDSGTGRDTVDAMLDAAHTTGAAVVLVTHDSSVAALASRRLVLRDGRLSAERACA
ncbi:ABC transporter ATP-binding protein [Actinoalloteichus caeruleus]|uniref:ABC transport system ATP-binding protein n=2 Tax=Actinoalloteichus cyanogriseus TaxID=2893586 RepID=A0ABT1JKN3_ACTCY|nr:ABC transporter ATP-binding protein [Actinoalloteichus caeruleus]MCP2333072.1 putative ABC transport system ATP-binding protein [Actinoalloteichus caeruleus DSM 43889]